LDTIVPLQRRDVPIDVTRHGWPYALALVPPALVMVVVVAQPWVDPETLLRDPLAVAQSAATCCSMYYGAVSQLGVLIWTATAAICLFTALALARLGQLRAAAFPLAAGLLTALLALDDVYMVHEKVFPRFGLPETLAIGTYVALAVGYVVVFRRELMAGRVPLLAMTLAAFAVSVAYDHLAVLGVPPSTVVEDGAKLFGITGWAVFHLEAMLARSATPDAGHADAHGRPPIGGTPHTSGQAGKKRSVSARMSRPVTSR
jgi:hypothetical protein